MKLEKIKLEIKSSWKKNAQLKKIKLEKKHSKNFSSLFLHYKAI
jgi:hypothetical protein